MPVDTKKASSRVASLIFDARANAVIALLKKLPQGVSASDVVRRGEPGVTSSRTMLEVAIQANQVEVVLEIIKSIPGLSIHDFCYREISDREQKIGYRGIVESALIWSGSSEMVGAAHRHGAVDRDDRGDRVYIDLKTFPRLPDGSAGAARQLSPHLAALVSSVLPDPAYNLFSLNALRIALALAHGGSELRADIPLANPAAAAFLATAWSQQRLVALRDAMSTYCDLGLLDPNAIMSTTLTRKVAGVLSNPVESADETAYPLMRAIQLRCPTAAIALLRKGADPMLALSPHHELKSAREAMSLCLDLIENSASDIGILVDDRSFVTSLRMNLAIEGQSVDTMPQLTPGPRPARRTL